MDLFCDEEEQVEEGRNEFKGEGELCYGVDVMALLPCGERSEGLN